MDGEFENMLDLKISNHVRNIKQSLNERLQEISDDFAKQTNAQIKEIREKVQEYDMVAHQMKMLMETTQEKMKQIESTLSEQVDIIHTLNDKVTSEIGKVNS